MISREIYLKNIADSLALLSKEVTMRNAINLYDINIIAEDFFPGLLNIIYGFELINVNHFKKNAAAIDLCDSKNKLSIQVTSDNSSTKVKHTIKEFIENESYKTYDKLIILILTQKKNYTVDFDTEGKFLFDKKKDIWDIESIIKYINTLETIKLKEINDYLSRELNDKYYVSQKTQASEVETIIDLIEYISLHKEVKKVRETVIDPEYKIYKRFREFANNIITEYTTLLAIYGEAIYTVSDTLGIDEAQDIIIILYLQDVSMRILKEEKNDPISALNKLVEYFEEKLSINGKKYDRMAIKFYLVQEMIKCRVFPNERGEYNDSK